MERGYKKEVEISDKWANVKYLQWMTSDSKQMQVDVERYKMMWMDVSRKWKYVEVK